MSPPTDLPSSTDFDRLLCAARNGDRDAQGRLLEPFRRPLLRLARTQLNPHVRAKADASDVVQDVFAKALQELPTFQGLAAGQVMEWLRAILTHTTTNFVRRFTTGKRRVAREMGQVSEHLTNDVRQAEPSAGETAIHNEQLTRLKVCMDRLPARYAEVVRLRYEERMSFEEIGERTGRTAEAARKRLARAVDALAGALA